jgi:hypothetical protein
MVDSLKYPRTWIFNNQKYFIIRQYYWINQIYYHVLSRLKQNYKTIKTTYIAPTFFSVLVEALIYINKKKQTRCIIKNKQIIKNLRKKKKICRQKEKFFNCMRFQYILHNLFCTFPLNYRAELLSFSFEPGTCFPYFTTNKIIELIR